MAIVERVIVQLGWEVSPGDQKKFKNFEESIDSLIAGAGKLAAGFGILTGVIAGAASATNKQTAELDNLAKSVGSSLQTVQALTDEIGQAGFNSEQLISLMEEVNNKIGEKKGLGKMTAVEEATKQLGLRFEELKKLAPEKQFLRILDAAKGMEDQQKAVSAVDMIMGGEANRILGHLRNVEGSMAEIIQRRLELNFLSQEGIDGAKEWNNQLGFVTASVRSMWQQFSGLLGKAITPLLKAFQTWVRANRELIQQKLIEFSDRFGRVIDWLLPRLGALIRAVFRATEFVAGIVENLGGFENAIRLLGIVLTAIGLMKFILLIRQFGQAAVNAQLKLFAWIVVIAAIILLLEDLWLFLEDPNADTAFRRVLEAAEEWLGIDLVGPIREAWPEIKEFLGSLWEGFKTVTALIIESVGNWVLFFIEALDNPAKAWENLIERMSNSWTALWPGLMDFFDTYVVKPITDTFNWISTKLSELAASTQSFLSSVPLVGSLFESGQASSAAATTNNNAVNQRNSISVNVTAQTNASAQDIGREVRRSMEEGLANAARVASTNVVR